MRDSHANVASPPRFGTMVNYWYYTGDKSYIDVTTQGLLSQIGEDNDYMPENQTKTEGNDGTF